MSVIWVLVSAFSWSLQSRDVGDRVPLTYQVEHQHRSGSCSGELVIDKWAFTYNSTDRPEDSRSWKVTDVKDVESRTPAVLVLKSKESSTLKAGLDKNYKFRVLGAGIEREVVDYMNRRVH